MGKIKTSINIFKYRPTLASYSLLNGERKELIDYTIENSLVANPVLRVNRFFKTRYLKPKQENLWLLTWNDIILLKKYINQKDLLGFLKLMYGIDEKQFIKLDAYNAFASWKWITNEIKKLVEIEVQELEEEIPDELKDAGIEEMQRFDYTPALDKMAGGDLTRYDEFLNLTYAKVFRKMVMEKVLREINEKYKENVSRKNQINSRNRI